LSSVLDRPGAAGNGSLPELRSLAAILAFEDEDPRFPKMDETWLAFAGEMGAQVREVLDSGRSPAERSYGVGAIVHNYFRARGVTLTSYELRALAGELVACGPAPEPQEQGVSSSSIQSVPVESAPAGEDPPAVAVEEQAVVAPESVPVSIPASAPEPNSGPDLVSFVDKKEAREELAWAGEETAAVGPVDAVPIFASPPSTLVNVVGRNAAAFDRLLMKVVGRALPLVGRAPLDRALARATIGRTVEEVVHAEEPSLSGEKRRRLTDSAFSEICGLGLLDRLWADRSVRAVYVDGPGLVQVERTDGRREPAAETFRDAGHLLDVAKRLAQPAATGVVDVQLRDGGTALVIFPPAAPAGPVLVLHRGEPGNATFDRLVAARLLDRRIAALLGIAARARLNIVVVGPQGAGKTALLAATARDLAAFRVVTVAAHRHFHATAASRVELVAHGEGPSFATLMVAGARLHPDLLVVDEPSAVDISGLAVRLGRGARGTLVAVRTDAMASVLAPSADLVVRLGAAPGGLSGVLTVEEATGAPIFVRDGAGYRQEAASVAFAGKVRDAGYGTALSQLFR
jgi:type IV secretory pathway ATPase VirB11/archaellum biosynthesis ATPase